MTDLYFGEDFAEIPELMIWNFQKASIIADNKLLSIRIWEALQKHDFRQLGIGVPVHIEFVGFHIQS